MAKSSLSCNKSLPPEKSLCSGVVCYDNMFQPLWLVALIFFPVLCNSTDTITPDQTIRDGETLISAGEIFALGFFSPGKSKNRYVGIWYNKIPNTTVVWTANIENPLGISSWVLAIKGGNLVLLDGGHNNNTTLWSTNVSTKLELLNCYAHRFRQYGVNRYS